MAKKININPAPQQTGPSAEQIVDTKLAELKIILAQKAEIEAKRKILEEEIGEIAEVNQANWFADSKTKNFENGKVAVVTTTKFLISKDKRGKAIEVMLEEYPEATKVEFLDGKLKTYWENDTLRTRLEGLGFLPDESHKVKCEVKQLPKVV